MAKPNSPIKLNLGCGIYVAKGWINLDKFYTKEELLNKLGGCKNAVYEEGAEYVQADICKMPFPDKYADHVEAHEVLEHLGLHQIVTALVEIRRVMKPGARFLASSPSFDGLVTDWLSLMNWPEFDPKRWFDIAQTIYGNQAGEGEFHRIPLNYQSVNFILNQAGFTKGSIGVFRAGSKATDFENNFELKIPDAYKKYPDEKRVLRNDTLLIMAEK